ncbi:IclR family transcriptional regulator [Bordetella petrii]|uniref:IclR family transcriptional regulator n=1 Tax=Bordetella petrii TaxID=94624 RepID=UPI001E5C3403|nr:IclR family transcriptional regulator [Bordetella petrii]MCD0501453.1 IclR family transcriptional regulator [Bordetella petrii]
MSYASPSGRVAPSAGTQTLQRAASLLRLITSHNRQGMRLVDLYRRTGMERPTAHRILQGLIAEKFIRQDERSKRYYLGSLIYEMGLAATPKIALRDICKPHLQTLADKTGDTVFMTVRSGFDAVCVARAEGAFPIKALVLNVGTHRPLNVGAGGLALLAELPDDEVQRICRANAERTLRKNPRYCEHALHHAIASARRRGHSVNKVMDTPAVLSVGKVIRYPDQRPAAAICICTLASRLAGERMGEAIQYLDEAVAAAQAELHACLHEHPDSVEALNL